MNRVLKFGLRVLAFDARIEKTRGMRGTPDPQLAMLTSVGAPRI